MGTPDHDDVHINMGRVLQHDLLDVSALPQPDSTAYLYTNDNLELLPKVGQNNTAHSMVGGVYKHTHLVWQQ
jgi:hypothetical protein